MNIEHDRIHTCDVVTGLTPAGLGRLAAVLGRHKSENPFPLGSHQHRDWHEHFRDVKVLESTEAWPDVDTPLRRHRPRP